jgi:hypothetical protein
VTCALGLNSWHLTDAPTLNATQCNATQGAAVLQQLGALGLTVITKGGTPGASAAGGLGDEEEEEDGAAQAEVKQIVSEVDRLLRNLQYEESRAASRAGSGSGSTPGSLAGPLGSASQAMQDFLRALSLSRHQQQQQQQQQQQRQQRQQGE